jgi:hypothetical protein
MGKIGPWRSLRILRIFSAKVDFLAFYVLFWAFFGLDTESEHISALQCALHTLESSITVVWTGIRGGSCNPSYWEVGI